MSGTSLVEKLSFSVALTFVSLVLWEQKGKNDSKILIIQKLESGKTVNISVTI